MSHTPINYKYFRLEEFEKKPDFPWDFSKMHHSSHFDISWVDKYPDKPWNFSEMHNAYAFNINWIDKFPDKEWNFEKIHECNSFDIWIVVKYPDKPWNFSHMPRARNFDITWVDKLPEKPWDFTEMYLCKKVNEYGNYNYEMRSNFSLSWVEKYPDKFWDAINILQSNDDLQKGLTREQLVQIEYLQNEEICRYIIVRKYIPNYQAFHIFPGVFYQIYQAIQLQDLSGDIFYLENWFTQDNLLEYARAQLSVLGEFDIAVEALDGSGELLMVSENNVDTIKCHLFQGKEGPQGMIVYQ